MGDGTPLVRLDSRAMTQADLTRQRLIRAALELFTTAGYHLTTTPLIAKKAGIAEGTIYRHFDSKQHLLNELYRAAGRWAGRQVKEADALKVGPREKLAELGRGLVAGAAREPAVAQLFFLQRHADLLDDESRRVARDFRLGLESLMAQGKADGSVKPGAVEVWAAVWLSVMSLVIDRVSGKEWPENHAGVALALEAAWDAIAAAPQRGRDVVGLGVVRRPVVRVVDAEQRQRGAATLDQVAVVLEKHLSRIPAAADHLALAGVTVVVSEHGHDAEWRA